MRRGYDPTFATDRKGRLYCIATGSDACAEHETGCQELLQALAAAPIGTAEEVGLARKNRGGAMPDLMQARRIRRCLDQIVFEERMVDGEAQAAVSFIAGRPAGVFDDPYRAGELAFSTFGKPEDVAGAWCSNAFAFRVRGEKKVAQLREFAAALKGGGGIFAGSFLKEVDGERLSGVVVAIEALLRPEHRTPMREAQAKFEADVTLYERCRINELRMLASKHLGYRFIHIWPVWEGGAGAEVAYTVNAGRDLKIVSYRRYAFEALRDWIVSGGARWLGTTAETALGNG